MIAVKKYMNRRIKINDVDIDYKVRKSRRAKRLRLAIYCDASIVVTLPNAVGESMVEKFLREKASWIFEKINYFSKHKGSVFANLTRDDFLKKKDEVRKQVEDIIEKYNKNGEFEINGLRIRNQKTRWGSCSEKGNININYKIIYLNKRMAEYIVFHELCHLKEFNHSSKFWRLVSDRFPDYREIRKELKGVK